MHSTQDWLPIGDICNGWNHSNQTTQEEETVCSPVSCTVESALRLIRTQLYYSQGIYVL